MNDFDSMFECHYRDLLAWCRRRLRPGWGDPVDLVHEAYLRSRRHWLSHCCSPGREVAYFYRALRWVFLDAIRRLRRDRRLHKEYPLVRHHNADELGELASAEALNALTCRERDACSAYLRGHADREVPAVAVYASRAKRKLCRELGLPFRRGDRIQRSARQRRS